MATVPKPVINTDIILIDQPCLSLPNYSNNCAYSRRKSWIMYDRHSTVMCFFYLLYFSLIFMPFTVFFLNKGQLFFNGSSNCVFQIFPHDYIQDTHFCKNNTELTYSLHVERHRVSLFYSAVYPGDYSIACAEMVFHFL